MRIWDAFFIQGVRIFYGIGLALLFRAEETLFHAKSAIEAEEYLRVTERSSIDADELFAHVFKEDLNISCKHNVGVINSGLAFDILSPDRANRRAA